MSQILRKSRFLEFISILQVLMGLLGLANLAWIFLYLKLPNQEYLALFFVEAYFIISFLSMTLIFPGFFSLYFKKTSWIVNVFSAPILSIILVIHSAAFYFIFYKIYKHSQQVQVGNSVQLVESYGNAILSLGKPAVLGLIFILMALFAAQSFITKKKGNRRKDGRGQSPFGGQVE